MLLGKGDCGGGGCREGGVRESEPAGQLIAVSLKVTFGIPKRCSTSKNCAAVFIYVYALVSALNALMEILRLSSPAIPQSRQNVLSGQSHQWDIPTARLKVDGYNNLAAP